MIDHAERKHSKFSASGAERWLNCPASVELEEASPPSQDSKWSLEGTLAHEVLESILRGAAILDDHFDITEEMVEQCNRVAIRIESIRKLAKGKLYVEQRVHARFIHAEMFGTCDAIIDGGKVLYIIDFKYGQSEVSPVKNPQLIQYALSVAGSNNWKWERAELWIMQPRINHFKSWSVSMKDLREHWRPLWNSGVLRVLRNHSKPFPGHWCHWCRAKFTCPAKNEQRVNQIVDRFSNQPLTEEETNGVKEKGSQKEVGKKTNRKKEKVYFDEIKEDAEEYDFY